MLRAEGPGAGQAAVVAGEGEVNIGRSLVEGGAFRSHDRVGNDDLFARDHGVGCRGVEK